MSTPQPPATTTQDDIIIQTQVGLADTPLGQRIAVVITALLPKDAAIQTGEAIVKLAGQLSGTRLIVAGPGGNGAVGQQP